VVGLGLGGPEARPKREPSDDVIILSQAWQALLIKPKIPLPRDTFLRLAYGMTDIAGENAIRVFMIHKLENTESWEDKAGKT